MTPFGSRRARLRTWLSGHAYAVLAAGALWTAFLPLLYGLGREAHSYQPDMLLPAALVALTLFVLGWVHPILYLVAALPVGLLNAVYAHVAHFWRVGNLEIRVETALDSSPGESSEFLRVFVLQSKFAWALMGYLAVALALGVLYARLRPRATTRTGRAWAVRGAALGLLLGLGALAWPRLQVYPAIRLGTTTYRVYTRVNPILERKERVAAFMATAPPLDCDARFDKIVFVLGESANRDFMSLYGYPRPTTPFLEGLEGKVVARAISPVNQTMSAVPIIMTPATVTDYEVFYTSPSIVSDLRRCGYETFWISNQLRYSPYTSSVSSIASEAEHVRFVLDDLEGGKFGQPDEVLLQLLPTEDIVPGRKQAFFIHLLGSHFDWKDRYPPDKALIPEPRDLRDIYANTIYYTDQVLAQIFARFQPRSENLLFIYTSDHGEWITPDKGGHAFSHAFQDEYRIPLVFWASDPTVLEPLAQAMKGRLVNTETLDRQVRYLVGLEDEPGVSYRTLVLSLGPGRVRDYLDLPYLEYRETP
ncbi:MAG: phosphoethanolamine transferase [Chloroflexi bacterium]|nr:phosphoethanolamine transferase [Chloroflexota bacterium]